MALDEDVPTPRVLQQTLISEQEEYPEEKEINAKIKEKKSFLFCLLIRAWYLIMKESQMPRYALIK